MGKYQVFEIGYCNSPGAILPSTDEDPFVFDREILCCISADAESNSCHTYVRTPGGLVGMCAGERASFRQVQVDGLWVWETLRVVLSASPLKHRIDGMREIELPCAHCFVKANSSSDVLKLAVSSRYTNMVYGDGRGALEVNKCEVSFAPRPHATKRTNREGVEYVDYYWEMLGHEKLSK